MRNEELFFDVLHTIALIASSTKETRPKVSTIQTQLDLAEKCRY